MNSGPTTHTPALTSRLINRVPFFYGWVVLGSGTLVAALTIPGQTVGVSVFLDSIIADLDINRSTVSVLYTVGTATGALSLTFVGRFLDRVGPRLGGAIIGTGFALACVFLGTSDPSRCWRWRLCCCEAWDRDRLDCRPYTPSTCGFVRRRGMAVGLSESGLRLPSPSSRPPSNVSTQHMAGERPTSFSAESSLPL